MPLALRDPSGYPNRELSQIANARVLEQSWLLKASGSYRRQGHDGEKRFSAPEYLMSQARS